MLYHAHNELMKELPAFPKEETETQKCLITCSKSHRYSMAELGLEPRSKSLEPLHYCFSDWDMTYGGWGNGIAGFSQYFVF